MVKNFTIDDWNVSVNHQGGQSQGIFIPHTEHQVQDPVIQVFENYGEGLFLKCLTDISVSEADDVLLITGNPFNGRVVIK